MKLEVLANREKQAIQNDIISKIQHLINYKNLEPGDRLPPERTMAEKFGVSRRSLSKAIQKLEFYGLLKSKPQSGTYLANIGKLAMNGIIDNILELEEPDFKALTETRIGLELEIVQYSAKRRTQKNLEKIKTALDAFSEKILQGNDSLQEDILFHLEIAKASGNSALSTLMHLITPEIVGTYDRDRICEGDEALSEIKKHEDIYLAIKNRNSELAKEKMAIHFTRLREYLSNM
ncbi:MAG: FadR/GntR family transcriptional regulator [Bacteroidia bacterium]|nr:FadR/GntR family transcriptional regulator [Bacteroidia bacterium]